MTAVVLLAVSLMALCVAHPGHAGETPSPIVETPTVDARPFRNVIRHALLHGPRRRINDAQQEIAGSEVEQASALRRPELSATVSQQASRDRWRGGADGQDPTTTSITLTQPVFNRPVELDLERARIRAKSTLYEIGQDEQDLLHEVIQNIIDVELARRIANISNENLLVTERYVLSTRTRYEAGDLTRTDVQQASVRRAKAAAALIDAKRQQQARQAEFIERVGLKPPPELATPPVVTPLISDEIRALIEATSEQAAAAVPGQRPDLLAAITRLHAAELNLDARRAEHLPTLRLNATVRRIWGTDILTRPDPTTSTEVELELRVPLFSGGGPSARVRQAQAERALQQARLDTLRQQAWRELVQAIHNLDAAQHSYQTYHDAIQDARDALAGVEEEFRVGTRTAIDLMDAQQEFFTTQTAYLQSHYTLLSSQYQILKASHALDPAGFRTEPP